MPTSDSPFLPFCGLICLYIPSVRGCSDRSAAPAGAGHVRARWRHNRGKFDGISVAPKTLSAPVYRLSGGPINHCVVGGSASSFRGRSCSPQSGDGPLCAPRSRCPTGSMLIIFRAMCCRCVTTQRLHAAPDCGGVNRAQVLLRAGHVACNLALACTPAGGVRLLQCGGRRHLWGAAINPKRLRLVRHNGPCADPQPQPAYPHHGGLRPALFHSRSGSSGQRHGHLIWVKTPGSTRPISPPGAALGDLIEARLSLLVLATCVGLIPAFSTVRGGWGGGER